MANLLWCFLILCFAINSGKGVPCVSSYISILIALWFLIIGNNVYSLSEVTWNRIRGVPADLLVFFALEASLILSSLYIAAFQDYVAAVVEYHPGNYSTSNQTLEENLQEYAYYIRTAVETQGAQIIVFPEYGLSGLVKDPANYAFEVPDVGATVFNEYLLTRLTDEAKTYSIYVVVNLLEKVNKSANGENKTIYYNTNIVFANNGTLVAKYRKINLFDEPNLTPGNETVTFTTDFGTFGLMTCFDILHYHPSQSILMNNSGLTNIIYPTAWFSILPHYMSLEVQAGYALANNVTLLASNLNEPSSGVGGSGIYYQNGETLRRALVGTPSSQLLMANIPTQIQLRSGFDTMGFEIFENRTTGSMDNYNVSYVFDHSQYSFKSLNLSQENITENVCHGSFCCSFGIVAYKNETNASEVYKLVAFDGRVLLDTTLHSVRFCNLIACSTDDVSTCGRKQTLSTKFRQLLVWGNFENRLEEFYRPATLGGDLIPLSNVTYLESKVNSTLGISLNITKSEENVLVFGLYGRGGAAALRNSFSIIVVAILFIYQRLF